MALLDISNLKTDIKVILDEKMQGEELAKAWGGAIGNWLGTVTSPAPTPATVRLLKKAMAAAVAVSILPIVSAPVPVLPPAFPLAFNTGLDLAAALILTDPAVITQISGGAVVVPPVPGSFIPYFASPIGVVGLAGGSTQAVADTFAISLSLWALTGTVILGGLTVTWV